MKKNGLKHNSEINILLQHVLPSIQEYINKTTDLLDEANTSMAETTKMVEKIASGIGKNNKHRTD